MSNTTPECSPDGITLTVNGTNFVPNGLVVNWNGSPRQTTYVSATQLTAAISATDAALPGTATVTVSSATLPLLASTTSPFTTDAVHHSAPCSNDQRALAFQRCGCGGSGFNLLGVDGTNTNGGSLLPCSVVELEWKSAHRPSRLCRPDGT